MRSTPHAAEDLVPERGWSAFDPRAHAHHVEVRAAECRPLDVSQHLVVSRVGDRT